MSASEIFRVFLTGSLCSCSKAWASIVNEICMAERSRDYFLPEGLKVSTCLIPAGLPAFSGYGSITASPWPVRIFQPWLMCTVLRNCGQGGIDVLAWFEYWWPQSTHS